MRRMALVFLAVATAGVALPTALSQAVVAPAPVKLPVQFPAPMPAGASASVHLPPSGSPIDPRFSPPAPPPPPTCTTGPVPGIAPILVGTGLDIAPRCTGVFPASPRDPLADAAYAAANAHPAPAHPLTQQLSFSSGGGATVVLAGGPPTFVSPDWIQRTGTPAPSARQGASMAFDGSHIVLFGGGNYLNDTWTFDGANWTQKFPTNSPPGRQGAGMAYDSARHQVVLFGGLTSATTLANDTWVWDGNNWTQLHPSGEVPSAREYPAMDFDVALGKTVLFGGKAGLGGGSYDGGTWIWDGTSWSSQGGGGPGGRASSSMVYDAAISKLVLFGGFDGSHVLGDTFTYDGTNWVQQNPVDTPSARYGHGMAYDPDLGRVILFGGTDGTNYLSDTWGYDGTDWATAGPIASPPARAYQAQAYGNHQVVLFGGTNGSSPLGDTWTLDTAVPTVTKVLDTGQAAVVTEGDTVSYRVTVGNPGAATMSSVTVTDTMPTSLASTGTAISITTDTGNNVACSGSVTCTVGRSSISARGLSLPGGHTDTVRYVAVAVGLNRACSDVPNSAVASVPIGSSPAAVAPVTVCQTGLGYENWWSYVTKATGPQAQASVNVSNGNLVAQATDSTPVQAHGRLAYVLRRTYNSQGEQTVAFPWSLGAGWQLNIGQTDDLLATGATANGLFVPQLQSVAQPVAITLIDQDGTHHVFQPRGLPASIDVTALSGTSGPLATLSPQALGLGTGSLTRICVDQTYAPPPGVHLSLWRYIAVTSAPGSPCQPATGTTPFLLGFGAERPDRVRYEFSASGQLLDLLDANGVDLRYLYDLPPVPPNVKLGNLRTVYEPRSCSNPTQSSCRKFSFAYSGDLPTTTCPAPSGSAAATCVTDPAGRLTTYLFDSTTANQRLAQVKNPDGSVTSYTYGDTSAACGATLASQLCSVSDLRSNTTYFHYDTPAANRLPRVDKVTDRRVNATTFTYQSSPDLTKADLGTERRRFQSIDSVGRVGEIDEGDTSDNYLHQGLYTWDAAGATTCRQPDNAVDNDLCQLVRKGIASGASDENTTYTYNPEGGMLGTHRVNGSTTLHSTSGFHAQYLEATGSSTTCGAATSTVCYDDTVAGSGTVTSAGPSSGRADASTVLYLSDRTQSLTPRGSAAGSGFGAYLTTNKVDDDATKNPNAAPAASTCLNPAIPSANTGNLCETDGPAFDTTGASTVTRYSYDTFGQRLTMTSPKAIAGNITTTAPACPGALACTAYTYYADSDLDLSGNVSAGGWLKAVSDASSSSTTTHFVAFAYDRAGNKVRTWDRNATNNLPMSVFPGPVQLPPSSAYAETTYGPLAGSGSAATPYSAPWRYPLTSRDPLGNTTTYFVDAHGNEATVRPPRGTAAGNTGFDITQTFDAADNLLTRQLPADGSPTAYTYDIFGNQASATDPNGHVQTMAHDSVNRLTITAFTRGTWPTDGSQPSACRQSTTSDAPIPTGRILCTRTLAYDGVDNKTSSQDANAQTTTLSYDAVHQETSRLDPRNDGTITTLRTDTLYDADGHVTDVCPPREFLEAGATSCTATGPYSTHHTFGNSGREASRYTYRTSGGAANTTAYSYDADGNPLGMTDANGNTSKTTYDVLGRKTSMGVPRLANTDVDRAAHTTTWTYDPVGNTTSVTRPGGRITAYSFDADNRGVDTIVGASSTDAAQAGLAGSDGGTNVRTRVAYDADGDVVARFDPRAFSTSTVLPDASFMARTDFDADGRPVANWVPRYDAAAHSDLALSTTQTAQCPTNPAPQSVAGVQGYPPGVGVCVTRLSYDAAGNRARLTQPTATQGANRFESFAYTDDNLLASVNSPSPATDGQRVTSASYLYDGEGREVKLTDALSHQRITSYFSDGLVNQATAPPAASLTHVVGYAYDGGGNRTQVTTQPGTSQALTTTSTYFTDNLLKDVTDPAGDKTSYVYDNLGNATQVTSPSANYNLTNPSTPDGDNPAKASTANTYTLDRLLASTTLPVTESGSTVTSWRRTAYGYDAAGRKVSSDVATVDGSGNIIVAPNAGGTTTGEAGTLAFSYYPDDRLHIQTGRDGASTITTTYDPAGNPATVADSSGSTLSSTYFLDGLVRTVDDGGFTSQYGYDGSGTRAARNDLKDANQTRYLTTYTYGDAGLASSMVSTSFGGTTTWAYDAAGRATAETDPNGETITVTYNDDDTLASQVLKNQGGSALTTWSYAYDSLYHQTQQSFSGTGAGGSTIPSAAAATFSFTYDNAGRLSSFNASGSANRPVTYDHDGNRLTYGLQVFAYNADDSIATATDSSGNNQVSYKYLPFGGLQNDGCVARAYDSFDRNTGATPLAGPPPGCATVLSATYAYDGLDRQSSHSEGGSTTAVHYDGATQSVGVEESGSTDSAYELSATSAPKAFSGGGAVQYLTDEGHGSIPTITNSDGSVACTARFDPYGSAVAPSTGVCNTGQTAEDMFYRGSRRDPTFNTYQLGPRTYDPAKAGFLTPDSYRSGDPTQNLALGIDPLTRNSYTYVNGDPVNVVDPDGHFGLEFLAVAAAISAIPLSGAELTLVPNTAAIGGQGTVPCGTCYAAPFQTGRVRLTWAIGASLLYRAFGYEYQLTYQYYDPDFGELRTVQAAPRGGWLWFRKRWSGHTGTIVRGTVRWAIEFRFYTLVGTCGGIVSGITESF